jgi:hypothetical protein
MIVGLEQPTIHGTSHSRFEVSKADVNEPMSATDAAKPMP